MIVLVFSLLTVEETYADTDSDLELARKFSPILGLTEETGQRGVATIR